MTCHSPVPCWLAVLAIGLTSCAMPETSRTALVKDIQIAEDVNPDNVLIHAGDEIRWVNVRKDRVQLDIPNLAEKSLSCQRGFTNWAGNTRESVHLKPNETVSLCFSQPTVINYIVRAETAAPGGRDLLTGAVRVAGN